jgi:hypothetical protein
METNLFGGLYRVGTISNKFLAKFLLLLANTHFCDLKLVKCHAINKCGGF